MALQTFSEFEIRRADAYRLLAGCFYEPQKEVFLQADLFSNLNRALAAVSPAAAQAAGDLQDLWSATSQEELLIEYARLFLGPNRLVAAPYGSCYLDEERLLMGESTLEVLRIYRENGVVMDEHFKEAPDHITVELEFQYYLIHQQVRALQKENFDEAARLLGVHRSFCEKFLAKWIPPFTDSIIADSNSEFYRQLAKTLRLFIEDDAWLARAPEFLQFEA